MSNGHYVIPKLVQDNTLKSLITTVNGEDALKVKEIAQGEVDLDPVTDALGETSDPTYSSGDGTVISLLKGIYADFNPPTPSPPPTPTPVVKELSRIDVQYVNFMGEWETDFTVTPSDFVSGGPTGRYDGGEYKSFFITMFMNTPLAQTGFYNELDKLDYFYIGSYVFGPQWYSAGTNWQLSFPLNSAMYTYEHPYNWHPGEHGCHRLVLQFVDADDIIVPVRFTTPDDFGYESENYASTFFSVFNAFPDVTVSFS